MLSLLERMIVPDLRVFILFSLISVTLHQHSGQTSCRWADWFSCNFVCIRPLLELLSSYPLLLPTNISGLYLQFQERIFSKTWISKYLKICTLPLPQRLAGGQVRGFSSRWRSQSVTINLQTIIINNSVGLGRSPYLNSTGRLDNLFPARSKKVNCKYVISTGTWR